MCDTYSWWWCLNAFWQTPQTWGPSCLWLKKCVLRALVVLNSFLQTWHLFTETLVLFPEPTGVRRSTSPALRQTEVDGQDVEVFLLSVSNEKDINSGLDIQKNTKQEEHRVWTWYISYLNQTWCPATVLTLCLAGGQMVRVWCRSHHWSLPSPFTAQLGSCCSGENVIQKILKN